MKCTECGCAMMADQARRRLPPGERRATRSHRGRGLCSACYSVAHKADTLIDHERMTQGSDALLAEAHILVTERGLTRNPALADTLGITANALTRALRRAARRGDDRAIEIRDALAWTRPLSP